MFYTSTRDKSVKVNSAQAIARGISKEGGLFVPESIPQISLEEIAAMVPCDYVSRAKSVLKLFLTDFTEDEINYCVEGAYSKEKFSSSKIAPIVNVTGNENVLELWHGPTCAFKDMALQLLPYLMTVATKKTADGKTIVILVATSGDTGKAALEGFKDVENTKILVFYPNDGVSPMQELQMNTQDGENVSVCAINGNFDDAQSAVKAIFTNSEIAEKLAQKNMMFSSANSINWGRLVPQIVYYFSAYCELLEQGRLNLGQPMNVVVPTGNFGNILAAFYAKEMGLPIKKLVCASNSNNVLTDFLKTGTYDRNRDFYTTTSPSMDILISSNLERLLHLITGENDDLINKWMTELSVSGKYTVEKSVMDKIAENFDADYCSDIDVDTTIRETLDKYEYLCDTHTAVAVDVYEKYVEKTGDDIPTVIDSTASPFKFAESVLKAILVDDVEESEEYKLNEFEMLKELNRLTKMPIPTSLAEIEEKDIRFKNLCEKEDMTEMVFKLLDI